MLPSQMHRHLKIHLFRVDGYAISQVVGRWGFVLEEKHNFFIEVRSPARHDPRYGATWPKVVPYLRWGAGGFVFNENSLEQTGRGGLGMDSLRWGGWGAVVWLLASLARPSHHDFDLKKALQCSETQDTIWRNLAQGMYFE